jgi:BirA family biotin operon repressor/biotin-[acetyl-CoA-carboxylase] ligase
MKAPRPLRPQAGSGKLGGPLVHLDTTGSTNDRARELAIAGAPDGTVVVAEEQISGRGRQGRSWAAPRGRALTVSVLRRSTGGLELLPLATAVAVCDACESVAPVRCQIKWPNDIWVARRKLAGILIETRPQERWCVIGIGLNVDTHEHELEHERRTATSLRIESAAPVDRQRTLEALLDRLAKRFGDLERRSEVILETYRERDALNGRRISWADGTRSGDAQGIDERGNLVVFTEKGERLALSAGEVHLDVE